MSEFLKAMAFRHACKRFDTTKAIPNEQFESDFRSVPNLPFVVWDGTVASDRGT